MSCDDFQVGDLVRHKIPNIWKGIGVVKIIEGDKEFGTQILTVKFKDSKARMGYLYFNKVTKLEKALK